MRPIYSLFAGSKAYSDLRNAVRGISSSNFGCRWRGKTAISGFLGSGSRVRQFIFTLRSRKHRHANARLVKPCYDMNLSPLIRIGKSLLAFNFATALPLLSFGQAVFFANGGQYSITGQIPGDQIHSFASINALGGYLVWDDNSIDGSGQGISAAALDSNFSIGSARFRVNQIPGRPEIFSSARSRRIFKSIR